MTTQRLARAGLGDLALAAGCGLAAFGLRRMAAALLHFDGRYGQDAYAYDEQARALAMAWRTRRPPPRFFWPQGYPALAALALAARGGAANSAQLVSALSSGVTAALAYLLAYDVAAALADTTQAQARRSGLLAGATLAAAALPMRAGVVAMADATALAWATMATWAGLRYTTSTPWPICARSFSPRRHGDTEDSTGGLFRPGCTSRGSSWLLLSAAGLALATQTRWLNALLALPLGLALAGRVRRRDLLSAGLLAGLLLLPQALVSASNPGPLLRHDWLQRWSLRNSLRRRLSNVDGHYRYRMPVALFYAQPVAHPAGLTPWLTPLLALGVMRLAAAGCWRELFLLVGWVGAQYGFLAGVPYQNFRYMLGYLPPLAALAGVGAAAATPRTATALGLAALATMLAWSVRDLRNLAALDRPYRAVADWAAGLAPGATLICFGPTATVRCRIGADQQLRVVELFHQTPSSLAALLAEKSPTYLALDIANLHSQWRSYGPEQLYSWIVAHCRLRQVAFFPPFTIVALESRT